MSDNRRRWLGLGVACLLAPAAVGCGSDDSPPPLPRGLQPGWNEIAPGGATTCALGGPYAFWVRPGTVNRLVIDFQGGGACWDALTCGLAAGNDAICTQTVDGTRTRI